MPLPGTSQAGLAESRLLSENSVMGRGWGGELGRRVRATVLSMDPRPQGCLQTPPSPAPLR